METLVVVEYEFEERRTRADVEAMETQSAWCRTTHGVRHLRSYLSHDGKRLVCVVTAPDVESVRVVSSMTGPPAARIYGAALHGPE